MGWIIAAAILLIIIALLACSVAVRFQYDKNGDITLKISYLFFTLYTIPARPKKKKAKKKRGKKKTAKQEKTTAKKAVDAPTTDEDKTDAAAAATEPKKQAIADKKKAKQKNKLTLDDIFALIRLVADGVLPPLKRLFKRIRIYDFCLYIVCGGDDAAEAALNYGKTNIAVGAALGNLDTFFTLKPYDVDIGVDFESEETVTECSCLIKLSLLAALAFAAIAIIRVLSHLKKHPESERAVKKVANMKK